MVDICLHVLHDLGIVLAQNEVLLIVGKFVGGDTVEGNAELIGDQTAEVGNQSEDTDTTCDGSWFCEDIVGRRTDPVTTRSCHTAHRHNKGLLGLSSLRA